MKKLKGFLFCAIIAFTVSGCSKDKFVYTQVVKASEEMNQRCPMVIDADTRLDNTTVTENPIQLTYNYTVVTVEKKDVETQLPTVKETMKTQIANTVNTNPEMKFYAENSIPLKYSYKDKNGVFLFDFTVTPTNKTEK